MTLPHFEQYTLLPPCDPAKAKREYGRGILRCADQPVNTESGPTCSAQYALCRAAWLIIH